MPRPNTSSESRQAVRKTLQDLGGRLTTEGKTPARETADKLGVTRQTACDYLRGETVLGSDRLGKLLAAWDLKFDYCGYQVDNNSFPAPRSEWTTVEEGTQQSQLEILKAEPLKIDIPRNAASLRLELEGQKLEIVIDLENPG